MFFVVTPQKTKKGGIGTKIPHHQEKEKNG